MMEKRICYLVVFTVCSSLVRETLSLDWWRPAATAKKFRGGEPTFIYTHGNNHWDQTWYTVQDRREFVFSVKACNSARLSLSTYIAMSDFSIEIMLGEDGNTRSMIKYPFEAGNLFELETVDLLNCFEYRTFWVSWNIDYIEVGRGPSVGQQKLMNWFDKSLHAINAIGFSSGDNTAAVYEIRGNTGDIIEVNTPDEYKYTTLWKGVKDREFYSFQVRTCGDAHILLTEEFGRQDGELYEFSLGGWNNNISVIRTTVYGGGGHIRDYHVEYGIVECSEFKDFWISWYNNTVRMGKGDIFAMRQFLVWTPDKPIDVRYLSITTGFGNTGSWILDDNEETFTMLHTPHSDTTDPAKIYNTSWIEMPKEHFFQFWVKTGGREARVLLADDNNIVNEEFDLQIIIGGADQKKVCVGYMFEPGCLAEYMDTDAILRDNHFRPFWISWFNHTLKVGKGYFYGERVMIKDLALQPDFHFNAIALATTMGWGRFKFREYMGERVDYRTPEVYTHYQDMTAWRTTYTKNYFLFYYDGESDCHVALSPTYGIDAASCYYDVIISGWGNTRTVITEACNFGANRKELGTPADTTGMLGVGKFAELWISWYNGFVEVGQGSVVGERRLTHHNFGDNLNIRALAVQSGFSYPGRFFMYENLGDYTTFYTNGTMNPQGWSDDHHMIMDYYVKFVTFWVTSCSDATVSMGQVQGDGSNKLAHFKIVFGAEGNTVILLYHETEVVQRYEQTPAVECDNNRQYWISWKGGKIEVGEGYKYPFNRFFEYEQAKVYNLTLLGFSTSPTPEKLGRWHLQHAYGPDFEMYTTRDYGFRHWFTVEHKDYVYFSVGACSDVHILLTEKMGHQYGFSYEIVIGGWNNTRSVIREWIEDEHGQRMPEYVVKNTPGILNCTAGTFFWLSWQDGVIMVGEGLEFDGYRGSWIDYHPVNPRHIRAVAFSTGYGHDGYWGVALGPNTVSPPVTEAPPTEPTVGPGTDGMSGGAIAGIVIAVLAVLVLFGAVGYLIMMTRGTVQTPEFLQTPAEGSGFENPAAQNEPKPQSNTDSEA